MGLIACALASPVRLDISSSKHLPRAFLIGFGAKIHPETGSLWIEPVIPEHVLGNMSWSSERSGRLVYIRCAKDAISAGGRYIKVWRWFRRSERIIWREDMPDRVLYLLRKSATLYLQQHMNTLKNTVENDTSNTRILAVIGDKDREKYNTEYSFSVPHFLSDFNMPDMVIPASQIGVELFWKLWRVHMYIKES